jgi:hypothetical protein
MSTIIFRKTPYLFQTRLTPSPTLFWRVGLAGVIRAGKAVIEKYQATFNQLWQN